MTLDADLAERALDARLDRGTGRPLAVAFSGGGDSLALLLIAKTWTDRAGRPLTAFTVDHSLQSQSGEWAEWCAVCAARIGLAHRILTWDGAKPERGLPAAARQARHRLIADAARGAGARVVLFGHTADDVLESKFMQAAGVHISAPADWSPSPVWPEGREIFVHRPLIGARRATIRAWLTARGETWIDDPANEDLRHPRARARGLAADATAKPGPIWQSGHPMAAASAIGPAGDISFSSSGWRDAPDPARWLGPALASASGSERPPRRDALDRLIARLAAGEAVNATLGGARVVRTPDHLIFARETGDRRGRACGPMSLAVGLQQVWDGRFAVRARESGLTLSALRGHAARLDARQSEQLSALHPAARAALPALIDRRGAVSCPTLTPDPRLEIRNLVPGRFAGAIGAIDSEAQIGLYG